MLLLIGFLAHSPAIKAASAISLAGIDFHQLCRETAHVPLVQAAIHPAYINVWSIEESREHRRYEQYTFRTQRIDVRVEHDISLYHGLIHRTLDLIGESQWKYRNLAPQEDHEHWLIYHTLEMHWPGMQRRQGNEPTRAILTIASEYWTMYAERYAEIAAKAAALARKSWCATDKTILAANAGQGPQRAQPEGQAAPLLKQAALTAGDLPSQKRTPRPTPEPPTLSPRSASSPPTAQAIQPQQPAAQAQAAEAPSAPQTAPAASLTVEPIGIGSEFAAVAHPAKNPPSPPPSPRPAEASTERPTPAVSQAAAPVLSAPPQPTPLALEPANEPNRAASEFFVALPAPEEKSPTPPWPAPTSISADLSAGNWR